MTRRRSQVGTFGSHLQHFARSVDIVDEQTLDDARNLVHEYIQEELDAAYFELATVHLVDDAAGLRTRWSSENKNFSSTIRTAEGGYSSQLAVSFDTGRPLWIVSPQREPLHRAKSYLDRWSGVTELPSYKAPMDGDLLTSIVLPMRRPNDRILGVMALESTTYLDITEFDTAELDLLADALGVLLDLRELHAVQTQGTRDAIRNLRRIKDVVVFPQIAKPQIFVAFSARADREVVGVLGEVLKEFSDRLRVVQWNRIADSGAITSQIADAIATSRFGLCYFSEPRADGEHSYADNPNVLFEAGMLHALEALSAYERTGWIPIREEDSPPLPFDFAGERVEPVPRDADGHVNEERFRSRLQARIERLLAS
jgi:hypothetical protein